MRSVKGNVLAVLAKKMCFSARLELNYVRDKL